MVGFSMGAGPTPTIGGLFWPPTIYNPLISPHKKPNYSNYCQKHFLTSQAAWSSALLPVTQAW